MIRMAVITSPALSRMQPQSTVMKTTQCYAQLLNLAFCFPLTGLFAYYHNNEGVFFYNPGDGLLPQLYKQPRIVRDIVLELMGLSPDWVLIVIGK